ncbi:MAG: META domain-containing protein [Bacteroidota bacterium]
MRTLGLVTALFALTACGPADPLTAHEWRFVSMTLGEASMRGIRLDPPATLNFSTESAGLDRYNVSGFSGCNDINGTYARTDDPGALDMSPMSTTRRGCMSGLAERIEIPFQEALPDVTTYAIDGDTLRLTFPRGTMVFAAP